jgi:beta-barrel assembly-enhancing protease
VKHLLAAIGLAVALVAPALAQSPKDLAEARGYYDQAQIYVQQEAWKEALDFLEKAEKKDRNNLNYRFAAAEVHLKLHKPDEAFERYEKVYKADPTNAKALAGMARSYEAMQNYREAVRMWMRYTRMPLGEAEKSEGLRSLEAARELFVANYEIAENPAGGADNLLTPEQELQIGFETAQSVAMETPLLFDPEVNTYVRNLCERLVRNAKNFPSSYKLLVLDSAEINAFATPGYIAVNRGLLEAAGNEAQLAGVLGHEIGHSVGRHVAKALTKQYQQRKAIENLQKQGGKVNSVLAGLLSVASPFSQLAFSRMEEAQADRLGVHIAFDTGYDPVGLIEMFRKFESMSPSSRSWWDKINRSHPMSIDRINAITEYNELLPKRELKKTSPEFAAMQARLKQLPPAPDAKGILK